jgi:hypothetical protein
MRSYIYGPGSRRPRNRLRKRNNRMNSSFYQKSPYKSLRVIHHPLTISKTNRGSVPEWNALHRSWVGFAIAKNQYDFEKLRKYAIVIRKFQRKLNLEISHFPDIGIIGFEEDSENRAEDDDTKLAIMDPWAEDAKENEGDDIYRSRHK